MQALTYWLVRQLLKPVLSLVQPRVFPEDREAALAVLRGRPVCFVLRDDSWTDRALLHKVCNREDVPRPNTPAGELPDAERAACLYLPALKQELEEGTDAIAQTMQQALDTPELDLLLVPVSVFWGRHPGSETSLFKLLLGDAERAGRFRKLLIILVQRKHVVINFGAPLSLREFANRESEPTKLKALVHRKLTTDFQRQKTAVLGPSLLDRQDMVSMVLNRQNVRQAIVHEAADNAEDEDVARQRARVMAEEIASNFDLRIIRFLEIVLTWVFRKIFNGLELRHVERLRNTASRHQVVYMPSHRSHFDYLLISYTLFRHGLVPPHIAAGVNLNFWPAGGLLRRGGAFYMRRSFRGARLYRAVFQGYLDSLVARGYPIEFYPEGGRSRSGRLLPPKLGLLNILLESLVKQPSRSTAFIPVYIGYDKMVEGGSYVKELSGGAKQKESAGQLLKARKIFDSSYGHPYVSFGEPIILNDALNKIQPDWRELTRKGERDWMNPTAQKLAVMNMERINSAVVVNAIGLVAMILLASPQRTMAKTELLAQIDRFMTLLRRLPYSNDMDLPKGSPEDILAEAGANAGLLAIDHPWGELLLVQGKEAVMLTYYRNSVMHVLALPSLIARFFWHSERMDRTELQRRAVNLYPFLKRELFLHYPLENIEETVSAHIDALLELGFLIDGVDGELSRPLVGSSEYGALTGLGRILQETFERYTLTSLLLVRHVSTHSAPRSDVEQHIQHMARRFAILIGRHAPEYHDKALFRQYLDSLIEQDLMVIEGKGEDANLQVKPELADLVEQWISLLGPDVQQSMQQVILETGASMGSDASA